MVSICAPVLRRYDCLRKLLASLQHSTVAPRVCIIDNGADATKLKEAIVDCKLLLSVHTPLAPMGVAESWNWFIRNVPQERIICNDDIQFSPDSIATIVNTAGDFVFDNNGFSCFLIRDRCVELVGEFDETISPGYAYFEDVDYAYRMIKVLPPERRPRIDAGITHNGSSTWQSGSADEIRDHWRRFSIAQANFKNKWGFSVDNLAGIV